MGRVFIAILSVCLIGSLGRGAALAQIIPDTTWGAENSIVIPNATIQGQPATLIEGGAIRGTNLFHSFQRLNVSDGQRLYFANPVGIQTVFSRVTGNTASNILGTLGVDGAANLFLMNPNGILFGPNARLDINGSFIATTASGIQFGNQEFFTVADPQVPTLLTINPSALWFNQTTAQPIINRSIANAVGLTSAPGQSLLLVGGQVQLEGGRILAPGGRVELAGVAGQGLVGLQLNNHQWQLISNAVDRADVLLTNNAQVNVRSSGGGDIRIHAKNVTMTGDGTQLLAGISAGLGSPGTQAGSIEIDATESIHLDASLIDNSVLENAIGNTGTIQVKTNSLLLTNGAQFTTNLLSRGNLGDITIDARRSLTLDETGSRGSSGLLSAVASGAEGNSSNITVTTGSLTVKNGAEISTSLRGRGRAGDITLNVSDTASLFGLSQATRLTSIIFSFVRSPTAVGDAGKITINTGSLLINDGAGVRSRTLGQGNSGDIIVNARDQVVLDGIKPPPRSVVGGLSSVVFDGAIGHGGNITLTTGSFVAKNGAAIDTSSSGQGNAGNITIVARESVVLNGTESRGGFPSGIFSSVERFPDRPGFVRNAAGRGGTVTVVSPNVSVTEGARIEARIADAPGRAGGIIIDAKQLNLDGASLQFGNSSGLFTDTIGNTTAPGGEIRLSADRLQVSEGALVSAVSQSNGQGGTIRIDVNELNLRSGGQLVTTAARQGDAGDMVVIARDRTLIEGNDLSLQTRRVNINRLPLPESARFLIATNPFSGLFANTEATSSGQGGTILLQTGDLGVQNTGQISVASQGNNAAGRIDVTARSIQSNQGRITAETTSSTGGDITLAVRDLVLRNNSSISTTAGTAQQGGNGGNITINAARGFIVGVQNENSDITANAFTGSGGRVNITTQSIYGLQFSPRLTPLSDITASSEFGVRGVVSINTPNLDPTQALANLPEVPVDVSGLIDQQLCAVSQGSQFVMTGRGGLPDSPTAMLNPTAGWEDWRIAESEEQARSPQSTPPISQPSVHSSERMIEAQGWVQANDGSIWLTATPATVTSTLPWLTSSNLVNCRNSNDRQ